ncbi:hypothetical protein [Streptomyces sp. NPDC093105]
MGTAVAAVEEKGRNGSEVQVETLERWVKMAAARAQEAQDGLAPAASAG